MSSTHLVFIWKKNLSTLAEKLKLKKFLKVTGPLSSEQRNMVIQHFLYIVIELGTKLLSSFGDIPEFRSVYVDIVISQRTQLLLHVAIFGKKSRCKKNIFTKILLNVPWIQVLNIGCQRTMAPYKKKPDLQLHLVRLGANFSLFRLFIKSFKV